MKHTVFRTVWCCLFLYGGLCAADTEQQLSQLAQGLSQVETFVAQQSRSGDPSSSLQAAVKQNNRQQIVDAISEIPPEKMSDAFQSMGSDMVKQRVMPVFVTLDRSKISQESQNRFPAAIRATAELFAKQGGLPTRAEPHREPFIKQAMEQNANDETIKALVESTEPKELFEAYKDKAFWSDVSDAQKEQSRNSYVAALAQIVQDNIQRAQPEGVYYWSRHLGDALGGTPTQGANFNVLKRMFEGILNAGNEDNIRACVFSHANLTQFVYNHKSEMSLSQSDIFNSIDQDLGKVMKLVGDGEPYKQLTEAELETPIKTGVGKETMLQMAVVTGGHDAVKHMLEQGVSPLHPDEEGEGACDKIDPVVNQSMLMTATEMMATAYQNYGENENELNTRKDIVNLLIDHAKKNNKKFLVFAIPGAGSYQCEWRPRKYPGVSAEHVREANAFMLAQILKAMFMGVCQVPQEGQSQGSEGPAEKIYVQKLFSEFMSDEQPQENELKPSKADVLLQKIKRAHGVNERQYLFAVVADYFDPKKLWHQKVLQHFIYSNNVSNEATEQSLQRAEEAALLKLLQKKSVEAVADVLSEISWDLSSNNKREEVKDSFANTFAAAMNGKIIQVEAAQRISDWFQHQFGDSVSAYDFSEDAADIEQAVIAALQTCFKNWDQQKVQTSYFTSAKMGQMVFEQLKQKLSFVESEDLPQRALRQLFLKKVIDATADNDAQWEEIQALKDRYEQYLKQNTSIARSLDTFDMEAVAKEKEGDAEKIGLRAIERCIDRAKHRLVNNDYNQIDLVNNVIDFATMHKSIFKKKLTRNDTAIGQKLNDLLSALQAKAKATLQQQDKERYAQIYHRLITELKLQVDKKGAKTVNSDFGIDVWSVGDQEKVSPDTQLTW